VGAPRAWPCLLWRLIGTNCGLSVCALAGTKPILNRAAFAFQSVGLG